MRHVSCILDAKFLTHESSMVVSYNVLNSTTHLRINISQVNRKFVILSLKIHHKNNKENLRQFMNLQARCANSSESIGMYRKGSLTEQYV